MVFKRPVLFGRIFMLKFCVSEHARYSLRVRFFGKIRIRIFESQNGFCASCLKSKNGFWIQSIHTLVDSLDQILIRIFRIHDPCVSFRNKSDKKSLLASGLLMRTKKSRHDISAISDQGKCYFLVKIAQIEKSTAVEVHKTLSNWKLFECNSLAI